MLFQKKDFGMETFSEMFGPPWKSNIAFVLFAK